MASVPLIVDRATASIVVTRVACARERRLERKWAWLLFIASGAGGDLNWSNGATAFEFGVALLGAVLYWARRRRRPPWNEGSGSSGSTIRAGQERVTPAAGRVAEAREPGTRERAPGEGRPSTPRCLSRTTNASRIDARFRRVTSLRSLPQGANAAVFTTLRG